MKAISYFHRTLVLVIFSIFCLHTVEAQSLESKIDALLEAQYKSGEPGATALVAKNGRVIYRNAFGSANLELNVPMKPENVFEIGSMTKQFTAVSILMLIEQGKLSLEDEITKFIPDYPTLGKKITVHHLLTHTSGIKSYTDMPDLRELARKDITPLELIDVFKNEPMDFDPGEEYRYNNSGYILLGYIIEKLTEQSYAEYIEQHIFKKLGMNTSYYGSKSGLVPNRAAGYMPTEKGYQNADYLSMTIPYAAGSLMSTVDDLLIWQNAMTQNKLISKKSKAMAHTNYSLNNGDPIYYGYGWGIDEIQGAPSVEHGGGIFGYVTQGVYIPSEDIYAVVLTNSNGNSPQDVTVKMAAIAMGKPFPSTEGISVSEAEMKKWAGTYEFDGGVVRYITFSEGTLYSQREGSERLKLYATANDEFYFEDSFTNYTFSMDGGKKVAQFNSRIRKAKGIESDKKAPSEKEAITVAPEILKTYIGKYELQPGFVIDVTANGNQLFAQATGQPQFEVFAESQNTFFLKVVAAKIVFNEDANGAISSLTLQQGGQEMEGKRLH